MSAVRVITWVIICVSVDGSALLLLLLNLTSFFSRRASSQDAVPRILGAGDGGVEFMADIKKEISSRISAVEASSECDNEAKFCVNALGGECRGLRNAGRRVVGVDGDWDIRVRREGGRTMRGRSWRIATSKSSLWGLVFELEMGRGGGT